MDVLLHPYCGPVEETGFKNEMSFQCDTSKLKKCVTDQTLNPMINSMLHAHCLLNEYYILSRNFGLFDPVSKEVLNIDLVYSSEGEIYFGIVCVHLQNEDDYLSKCFSFVKRVLKVLEEYYHTVVNIVIMRVSLSCHIHEIYWN